MTDYFPVTPDVIEMAESLINLYHEDLEEARLAILFRAEAPTSQGRVALGKAAKVSARARGLLLAHTEEVPHFVIWIAFDWWEHMSPQKKRALLDHELQHCYLDDKGEPRLRGHDIEEFNVIVERHGLWKEDLEQFGKSARAYEQLSLLDRGLKEPGWVKTMEAGPELEGALVESAACSVEVATQPAADEADVEQLKKEYINRRLIPARHFREVEALGRRLVGHWAIYQEWHRGSGQHINAYTMGKSMLSTAIS